MTMNKRLLFLAFTFLVCTSVRAQTDLRPANDEQRSERFARIQAACQAYMTEQLELTQAETKAFFPLFWDYQGRMHAARQTGERLDRLSRETTTLTEGKARQRINGNLRRLQEGLDLRREATEKYLTVLPATKVIRINEVERDFRQQLRERMGKRRN
jgi:hypothetical protein